MVAEEPRTDCKHAIHPKRQAWPQQLKERQEGERDGKVGNPPIADTKLCQAGLAYLDTLAAMPEAAWLRIYGFTVELMARS